MGKIIQLERFTCACGFSKLKRLEEDDFDLNLCPKCGAILFWGEMCLLRKIRKVLLRGINGTTNTDDSR
jgi:hypothetical protein